MSAYEAHLYLVHFVDDHIPTTKDQCVCVCVRTLYYDMHGSDNEYYAMDLTNLAYLGMVMLTL